MINLTPVERPDSKWLVVYTRSRWEKKVDKLLQRQNIKSFCPVIKTRKRWADRIKTVEVPLFSSYLFIDADLKEQLLTKQTTGVVNFVHCGKPAFISHEEIQQIKKLTAGHHAIEVVDLPRLKAGDQVRMEDGLFLDWQGEVLKVNGKSVVMMIKELNCALVVDTNKTLLTFVNKPIAI